MAVAIAALTADAPAGPGSGGHMAGMAGLAQSATPRSPRRRARLRETVLSRKEVPCSVMARFPRRWTRSRIVSGISAPRKPPYCHRRRLPFERRHAFGNHVERLLVDRIDRHPRGAVEAWLVERSNLQDHQRQVRPPGGEMRAAVCAEFAC